MSRHPPRRRPPRLRARFPRHRGAGREIPGRDPRRRGRPPRNAGRPHRRAFARHEDRRARPHRGGASRRQPDDPRRNGDGEARRRDRGGRQGRHDVRAHGRDHDQRLQGAAGSGGVVHRRRGARHRGACASWASPSSRSARTPTGRPSSCPAASTGRFRPAASRSIRATSSWGTPMASWSSSGRRPRPCCRLRRRRSPTRRSGSRTFARAGRFDPGWLDPALRAAGVLKEGEAL